MKKVIRAFDRFLRWAYGVYEFCDDPACLFRLRLMHLSHPVPLGNGILPAGSPVLDLHLWNEHVIPIPAAGPDVAWAVQMSHRLRASLHAIARQVQTDAHLAGIEAIGGVTVLVTPDNRAGGKNLLAKLGFVVLPYYTPLGRFGEFWENLYSWAIMWAYNAASLRQRHLLRLRRSEFWMPIADFLRRYGTGEERRPCDGKSSQEGLHL